MVPSVAILKDTATLPTRRTTADEIFTVLHADIATLRLLPGDKISEVDVAARLDVSRQPVREAFIRLDGLGLLHVRPQKATVVRRFSLANIRRARFVRCAIEVEVVREVCPAGMDAVERPLQQVLERQRRALDAGRLQRFHELDHEFHQLLCRAAGQEDVSDTIAAQRAETDRLCLLSLDERTERELVYDDHVQIVAHLRDGATRKAIARLRTHLGRLDSVIREAHASHRHYFTDD